MGKISRRHYGCNLRKRAVGLYERNSNYDNSEKRLWMCGLPFRTKIGDVDYDFENNEVRVVFKVVIDATLLKKLTSFGWKHNKRYDYWLKPIKKENIEYARNVLVT